MIHFTENHSAFFLLFLFQGNYRRLIGSLIAVKERAPITGGTVLSLLFLKISYKNLQSIEEFIFKFYSVTGNFDP